MTEQTTRVPSETIRAYRGTLYEVVAQGMTLRTRIDSADPALDAALCRAGVNAAAIITAYNPRSVALCEHENRAAHESLHHAIREAGLTAWPTRAIDPTGTWPIEPGFCVLGPTRVTAKELGRRFDQNGIVWLARGRAPELVLLR